MRFIQEPEAAPTPVRRSSYVLRLVSIFPHKPIQSKEYCFMRSCKIFTNAYGKRGDLTLCKVLKIGQFLPVSVQYMLCCLRIEVKTGNRKNHTVQSSLPGIIPACAELNPVKSASFAAATGCTR